MIDELNVDCSSISKYLIDIKFHFSIICRYQREPKNTEIIVRKNKTIIELSYNKKTPATPARAAAPAANLLPAPVSTVATEVLAEAEVAVNGQ